MGDDSRRESPRRAHVSDGRRCASPRRDLAPDYVRMFIGEFTLRGAFGANAPTSFPLGVAPRRGAPTTLPRVLLANIGPMQFCKWRLFASIDRKTFSGVAVKLVGAFASARRRRRRLPEQEMRPCERW